MVAMITVSAPAKIGLDRRRAAELNDRQFAGEHRLQRQRAAWNADRFDAESMLLVEAAFLGEPHRHLRRRRRAAADANSIDLFFLACNRDGE